jgi:cytochrome c oxidase subunit II
MEGSVMLQQDVWAVSIVGMGALAAVFGWVALGANEALVDYGPAIATAYRLRTWLFGIAVLVLIACNYQTLGELPYVRTLSTAPSAALQPVEVMAEQWSWSITPSAFHVGQTAEFHVTSKDVNHGFALYGPDMRIVAQTQAMPGYINVLRYTFDEPGTYHVMCLEYCGAAHHMMTADITVAEH